MVDTVQRVLHGEDSVDLRRAHDETKILAGTLPEGLLRHIELVRREQLHATVIHIDPVYLTIVPYVPTQHREPGEAETAETWDVAHLLLAFAFGNPFTWSTIQSGVPLQ